MRTLKLFFLIVVALLSLHVIMVNIRLYNIQTMVERMVDEERRENLKKVVEEDIANIVMVNLTYYHPVAEQCDSTPLITADNSRIDLEKLKAGQIKWCAISQDLKRKFPFGSKINIDGVGEYYVRDVMNQRHRNRIDILVYPGKTMRLPKGKVHVRKVS